MELTPEQEKKFEELYKAEQEAKFQKMYEEEQIAKQNAYPEESKYLDAWNPYSEIGLIPNPKATSQTLSTSDRVKAGFIPESARAEYLKKNIPADRIRVKDGETQILDQDNVWRSADGFGTFVGQVPSTVGDIVGGVGGAIGGGLLGSPGGSFGTGAGATAGGAAGSALGTYGGRQLEAAISRKIDPENALSPEEASLIAKEDAKTSALWSVAGDTIFAGYRLAKGWVRGFGPAITPSEARLLTDNAQDYEAAARTVGAKYRRDQATNFGSSDKERAFQSKISAILQNPEVQSREYWRQKESYDAVEAYLQPGPMAPGYKDDAGEQFNIALGLEKQDTVGAAEKGVSAAKRQAARALAAIPSMGEQMPTLTAAGQQIRALREAEKAKVDKLYMDYRKAIGQKEGTYVSKYQIPITRGILAEQRTLDKLANNAIVESQRNGRNIFAVDLKELSKKGKEIDLAVVDDAIQRMSKAISMAQNGKATLPVEIGDLIRVRNKFKEWREKTLKDLPPEIRNAHDMAEAQYKVYAAKYKQGMINQLLTKDESGAYKLSDPQTIVRMFNAGDKRAIDQLVDIASGSPDLQSQLRKLAFAHYRDHVVDRTPTGDVINLAKEEAYMKGPLGSGMWENLKPLFSPADQVLLTKAGGLGRAVLNAERKLEEVKNAWSKAAGGKIEQMEEMSPGGLVNRIFSDSSKAWEPHQILYAMRIVEKHAKAGNISPTAVDEFRTGIRTAMLDRIKDPNTGELSLPRLQSVLNKNGKRLTAALGPEYVHRLENVVTLLGKERLNVLPPGDPKVLEGVRAAAFGALSREGMIARIAGGWRKYNNQVRLYEVLMDPEKLKEAETFYQRAAFGYGAASGAGLLAEDAFSD